MIFVQYFDPSFSDKIEEMQYNNNRTTSFEELIVYFNPYVFICKNEKLLYST